MHHQSMSKPHKTVCLTDEQRVALEAVCRRRKVDALVWKRTRSFLLLDAGEDAGTVCRILDIGPSVLTEYGQSYSPSGAAKLMRRLELVYKKPQLLPAQADEAKQAAFIAQYEALMTGLAHPLNKIPILNLRLQLSLYACEEVLPLQ